MSVAVRSADIDGLTDRFFRPGSEDDPGAWDRSALSAALAVAEREADARPADPDPAILRAALLLRLGRREPAREVLAAVGASGRVRHATPSAIGLMIRLFAALGDEARLRQALTSLIDRRNGHLPARLAPEAATGALFSGDMGALHDLAAVEGREEASLSAKNTPTTSLLQTLRAANLTEFLPTHIAVVRDVLGERLVWTVLDLHDEEDWPPFVALRFFVDGPDDTDELEEAVYRRLAVLYRNRVGTPAPYLGWLVNEISSRMDMRQSAA